MAANILFGFCAFTIGILTSHVIAYHSVSLSQRSVRQAANQLGQMLFDFTANATVDNWEEMSDTVRTVGMSKAAFIIQKTQLYRRAVFFSLLNPQSNGAAFAGVRICTAMDLSQRNRIIMRARGQGNNHYKIVLRHKGQNDEPYPTYENFFESTTDFSNISLNLGGFKPYYRGRPLNSTEAEPLDISAITCFGIQIPGGVYSTWKQSGPSALEIDWISSE